MMKKVLSTVLCVCLAFALLPTAALAAGNGEKTELNINVAPIVFSDNNNVTVGGDSVSPDPDGYIITGTSKYFTINVTGGTHDITLSGVDITPEDLDTAAFSISGKASVNLTLEGSNVLTGTTGKAGLEVPSGATLTINGSGSLTATGGEGYEGNYTGMGDELVTLGGGAGIGGNGGVGGVGSDAGRVTINGGTVTAIGTDGGAGIGGGGAGGAVDTVTINGGTVTATGGNAYTVYQNGGGGAGIGGGGSVKANGGNGGAVTIKGGKVKANGGGAGIGGGGAGIGGGGGAGIGGGGTNSGGAGGTVTIEGGTVEATGVGNGAGIGGSKGDGGTVTIEGGTVNISATTHAIYAATLTLGKYVLIKRPAGGMKGSSKSGEYDFQTILDKEGGAPAKEVSFGYPTVDSVTVASTTASIQKGNSLQFTATVTGVDDPAQTVTWSVEGGSTGTSIDENGKLTVAATETATMLTVKAISAVDATKYGTATVTVTTPADPTDPTDPTDPPAPPAPGGGYDYAPPDVTVYNDPSAPDATVWLTGSGLDSNDQLITTRDPQGSAFQALLKLANSGDVISTYNIYLRSGRKSSGSAMHLTFNLNAKYAGQDFTLVHQKADGTYEYFYDTADANGDLTFGPLYELSPFLLVKGTLTAQSVVDIPQTGDAPQTAALAGVMLIGLLGLGAAIIAKRKRV